MQDNVQTSNLKEHTEPHIDLDSPVIYNLFNYYLNNLGPVSRVALILTAFVLC